MPRPNANAKAKRVLLKMEEYFRKIANDKSDPSKEKIAERADSYHDIRLRIYNFDATDKDYNEQITKNALNGFFDDAQKKFSGFGPGIASLFGLGADYISIINELKELINLDGIQPLHDALVDVMKSKDSNLRFTLLVNMSTASEPLAEKLNETMNHIRLFAGKNPKQYLQTIRNESELVSTQPFSTYANINTFLLDFLTKRLKDLGDNELIDDDEIKEFAEKTIMAREIYKREVKNSNRNKYPEFEEYINSIKAFLKDKYPVSYGEAKYEITTQPGNKFQQFIDELKIFSSRRIDPDDEKKSQLISKKPPNPYGF